MEPLVIVWRVTERCDTACAFCAYDVRLARSRREVDGEDVVRFAELVARWAGGRRVLVSFLGGEPLLWPPLREVSEALHASGLPLSLTTNGRLLPRFLDLAASLAELTVSLDGPPGLHDRLRGRPGLGASILASLAALAARSPRPRLRVNTVLTDETAPRFAELAALVAAAGVDELTFNALGGNDRPAYFARHRLPLAGLAAVAAALPAARAAGLRVSGGGDYLARLAAGASDRRLPVADCGPGARFWFVEVDGQLAPCSFTVGARSIPIHELRTPADLDALPARLGATPRAAACDDCPSTQVHGKFAP